MDLDCTSPPARVASAVGKDKLKGKGKRLGKDKKSNGKDARKGKDKRSCRGKTKKKDAGARSSAATCAGARGTADKTDEKKHGHKINKRPAASAFVEQLVASSSSTKLMRKPAASLPPPPFVRVGSDCTGLASEALALNLAGVHGKTMFCSEIDDEKVKLLSEVHELTRDFDYMLFRDIHKRRNEEAPQVDLFVSGAPCPAWSSAGKKLGLEDLKNRGITIFYSLDYVRAQRPRVVVLENVRGLMFARNHHVVESINLILEGLNYKVWSEIVDTRHHGVPQSRPRVYFVAIRKDSLKEPFAFPPKIKCRPLHEFLQTTMEGNESDLTPSVWSPGLALRRRTFMLALIHGAAFT